MKQKFTIQEAIAYCKNSNINMLISDINFMEEDAVFKLFNVAPETLDFYIQDSLEDSDTNCIIPNDLQLKTVDIVWLDTSKITPISDENVNDLIK